MVKINLTLARRMRVPNIIHSQAGAAVPAAGTREMKNEKRN